MRPKANAFITAAEVPALLSVAGVLAIGLVFAIKAAGPITEQMLHHLLAMSVLAPLIALMVTRKIPRLQFSPSRLWKTAFLNIVCLAVFHAPGSAQGQSSIFVQLLLLIAVFVAAVWFWTELIDSGRGEPWITIAPLLIVGKFACLIGALLVFAPRDIYGLQKLAFSLCSTGGSTLEDQQMAGLLMISACPLSYIVAAIANSVRMLVFFETSQESLTLNLKPK